MCLVECDKWIQYRTLVDDLHVITGVNTQSDRIPKLPGHRPYGFLLLGQDQNADRVTFDEPIERQRHRLLLIIRAGLREAYLYTPPHASFPHVSGVNWK